MKKILPLAGGVCGVLSGIGMICGMIWDIPKFVWLFIAIGYFILAATILWNFYCLNKKK